MGEQYLKARELLRSWALGQVPRPVVSVLKTFVRESKAMALKLSGRYASRIKREWDLQTERAAAENSRGKKRQNRAGAAAGFRLLK